MCLITEMNEPLVAEEDITVYKVFRLYDSKLYAVFMHNKYDTDEPIPVDMRAIIDGFNEFSVTIGYHSFANMRDALNLKMRLLHELGRYYNYVVKECIIPRGSKYYIGVWDGDRSIKQYASSEIIIKNFND